jgi:hypothetical protein
MAWVDRAGKGAPATLMLKRDTGLKRETRKPGTERIRIPDHGNRRRSGLSPDLGFRIYLEIRKSGTEGGIGGVGGSPNAGFNLIS